MWKSKIKGAIAASLLIAGMTAQVAQAQTFPSKPIRIIAPATPGSPTDILARMLADGMGKSLKSPIIVDNKPGVEQLIGLEHVIKQSPPDGHTMVLVGLDSLALLPITRKDLRINLSEDLTVIAGVAEGKYILAGPASAPYANFGELVKAIKAEPGKFSYGASAPTVRFPSLTLMHELGLRMEHVPYRGGSPYALDLASGLIQWGFLSETTAHTVKDLVRFYAISGKERSPSYPNVPTFAELGFQRIQGPAYALALRKDTPAPIKAKISEAAKAAIEAPSFKAKAMQSSFLDAQYEDEATVARSLAARIKDYRDAATNMGIKPE